MKICGEEGLTQAALSTSITHATLPSLHSSVWQWCPGPGCLLLTCATTPFRPGLTTHLTDCSWGSIWRWWSYAGSAPADGLKFTVWVSSAHRVQGAWVQ
ncbi:g8946 [Coccomyxa elongata]